VWILRSALLRSTTLNPVDHLEHLISKVNWVNFEINSVLPSLFLVFVEKVLTCLFTPFRQLSVRKMDLGPFGSKRLVFDGQHNLWTNEFASVCICSSQMQRGLD
jgi:hypothetical protein